MATTSDEVIEVVDEPVAAEPAGQSEPQGAADVPTVGDGHRDGIGPAPVCIPQETELTTYRTNQQVASYAVEPSVLCQVMDEITTDWQKNRYTFTMALSSSATDLYSLVGKKAGYVDGTFELFWRKQDSAVSTGEEEVQLHWKSTATLHEMGMPSEPTKAYLLLKERADEQQPQKVAQESTAGASASAPSTTINTDTKVQVWNNTASWSSNYYSSYNYNAKSDTGFVGLVNQAMTCYLNSLLQTLYMTPEFRNALYQWQYKRTEKNAEVDTAKNIPYQLQRLFIQLQTANKRAVETTDVTKSFGWDSSDAWQQHDVQELCRVMFDALEKRFKKDGHQTPNLINDLYQGTMKDYVKCLECGYESAREDHFLDIPLVIKPFGCQTAYGSTMEALQGFVQPETLAEENQYFCERCNRKCDAHKGLKFTKFPYLLTLQLKRFDFDYSTMHRMKLNDRMTFPKVLDLNCFINPEDMPAVPLGVEDCYKDFVVEKFDRPPPYSAHTSHSSAYGSTSYDLKYEGKSYTIKNITETAANPNIKISTDSEQSHDQSHDESADAAEEDQQEATGEPAKPDPPSIGQLLTQGPYVYELFSIMVHSGSAIGGHYYAYIKSFSDRRWYCFNDQSVSKITEEDIELTYGGTDSRSRGYYSSMYASSANAYMLMYRRVDVERNCAFITSDGLPPHVQQQIEDEKEHEKRERQRQEWEKNLCKFRLFCKHPRSKELYERRLEVHKDRTLLETTEEAYRVLDLKDLVPVERCRLVKYDEYTETMDQSFDEQEGMTFGQLVGGARAHYSYELFMEMRAEDEVFKTYKKGGLNLKVLVVDLKERRVLDPVFIRAEQGWEVAELKTEIAEKLHMGAETMNVALETYQSEGKHLANPQQQLRIEGFYRKHTVFVCSDPEDYQKEFKESGMNCLIDEYANSILLNISLPPPPRKKAKTAGTASAAGQSNSSSQPSEPMESDVDPRPESERDQMDQTDQPDVSQTSSASEPKQPDSDSSPSVIPNGEATSSQPEGEDSVLKQREPPDGSEGAGDPPAAGDPGLEEERPQRRDIQCRIDRRNTLADLKKTLEQHVGQTSDNFKIYRVYSNNQEYELFRLNDALTTVPNETKMIVRMGRALKPGEFRIKLFLLRIREVEFCKALLDSIVAKGMTVMEFKEQIIKEAYEQGVECPAQIERLRLRKKTWRSAGTVYLNDQIIEKDIHVFANFEMYVEPLEAPDPMTYATQMQVYIRRWRPSMFTVEPTQEILLEENNPEHLRKKISKVSGIPWERVEFGKGYGTFPCEISVLDIEDDLDWNPNVTSISSMPLSIYDDGAILYYKDSDEKLAELTAEKRSELQKQENARLSKYNIHGSHGGYSRVKERALKIYTDDDDERSTTADS